MSPSLTLALMIAFFAAAPARAESFKSWAARGAREEREKDPKAAFSSYSNALTMWQDGDGNAGKAKVLCARAGLREKDGDDTGALGDLSECLALDKKNSRAFHRRGVLLLKAGKTPAAIGDFYRAVALDIRFAQAYADRARAYESQGEKGFAHEDYRNACNLGVKAACAKAKALAPKPSAKSKSKSKTKPKSASTAAPSAAEDPVAADEKEPVEDAAAAEEPPEEAPAPAVKKKGSAPAAPSSYWPKFKDCVTALDACIENGDSFGACVRAAPSCAAKPVKGCCPAACLKAYQKSINQERSEAAAYREHFALEAACAIPPKAEED
jgi:tetratricopeptide (TPR) repeat protein